MTLCILRYGPLRWIGYQFCLLFVSQLEHCAFLSKKFKHLNIPARCFIDPHYHYLSTSQIILFTLECSRIRRKEAESSRADLGRSRTNLSAMHDEINTRTQRKHNAAFFCGTSGTVAKLRSHTTGRDSGSSPPKTG